MEVSTIGSVRRLLSRHPKKTLDDTSLAPAGVLLLLYLKDGEYCVLLNKRSNSVEDHKGEISFPGGRRDDGDRAILDTALRETHEEMGIRPQDVEVLGELDDVATISNFLVSTFVGTIPTAYQFKPSDEEVAEVIELPLSVLTDDGSSRDETRIVEGALVSRRSYAYGGHLIFGATAEILTRFIEILDSAPAEEAVWKKDQP